MKIKDPRVYDSSESSSKSNAKSLIKKEITLLLFFFFFPLFSTDTRKISKTVIREGKDSTRISDEFDPRCPHSFALALVPGPLDVPRIHRKRTGTRGFVRVVGDTSERFPRKVRKCFDSIEARIEMLSKC